MIFRAAKAGFSFIAIDNSKVALIVEPLILIIAAVALRVFGKDYELSQILIGGVGRSIPQRIDQSMERSAQGQCPIRCIS